MINVINQQIYTDQSSNHFEVSGNLDEVQTKIRTIINETVMLGGNQTQLIEICRYGIGLCIWSLLSLKACCNNFKSKVHLMFFKEAVIFHINICYFTLLAFICKDYIYPLSYINLILIASWENTIGSMLLWV